MLSSNPQGKTYTSTPYGYYDGTQWLVMYQWTEKDFIDHGCTNFPK
jgi:hypothetical protein